MCDMTQPHGSHALYVGLAFEIADLVLVKSWAGRHQFRVSIRLDHEEFEEVIAFQTTKSRLYRFVMWRDAEAVFVQPLVGRETRYGSVTEALERAVLNWCNHDTASGG
jgi:hypothetical protein